MHGAKALLLAEGIGALNDCQLGFREIRDIGHSAPVEK
jgi:hypothetical protein